MKQISILLLSIIMFGCSDSPKRAYVVRIDSGSGWSWSQTAVYCDSANMISTKEADVYVDGMKTRLIATNYITINSTK